MLVWKQEIKDPLCKQLGTRQGPAIVLMVDLLPHFQYNIKHRLRLSCSKGGLTSARLRV